MSIDHKKRSVPDVSLHVSARGQRVYLIYAPEMVEMGQMVHQVRGL